MSGGYCCCLYMNGSLYGCGDLAYMTELIRDYVEYCEMYGKDSVRFDIRRGLPKVANLSELEAE